ncbi:MAG: outer membrane lipoprotein LolB [Gammaproteobacteria bacterium]|nr:outer membrane lipoprotein LolB [Gammaproteobacteria bacterium]
MIALAAGCVTPASLPPVENPAAAWQARQAVLNPINAWKIQGRLSIRTAAEGGQASLLWVRDGVQQRLDLTGPLGRGHLRLTQNNEGAELRDADKKTWRADNAEQLLYRTTGWWVPLDGLNYWVLGLPMPYTPAMQELDDQGRLKTLVQAGWEIQFLEYAQYGSLDLPQKFFVKRKVDATEERIDPAKSVEVRLVIEHWTLN